MVVPMELAAAARLKLVRAPRRGPRVGPGDLEGHRRRRSLTGHRFRSRGPDGSLALEFAFCRRILRNRAGSRAERPDSDHSDRIFEPESPLSTKINMLWLRTQSNKPLCNISLTRFSFVLEINDLVQKYRELINEHIQK